MPVTWPVAAASLAIRIAMNENSVTMTTLRRQLADVDRPHAAAGAGRKRNAIRVATWEERRS